MLRIIRWITGISLFISIFLAIFYLRMIPSIGNPAEFTFDSAFHYRMTDDIVQKGSVAPIDFLSTYPQGKDIAATTPTALYHICASFHKLINNFYPLPLERSILLFCALCGSLICIPIYLLSYEIYRNRITALMSAFLSGIIPAYLQRTFCYRYRYEIVAVPLLFMSLLFFIKAFGTANYKKSLFYSLISALLIILASYFWRAYALFLLAYIIALLYFLFNLRGLYRDKRIILFIALGLTAFAWSGLMGKNILHYFTLPLDTLEIILYRIGLQQDLSAYARLLYFNQELTAVSLWGIFSWKILSLSGIFAVFYFFSCLNNKNSGPQKKVLFIFLIFFFILTLTFFRNEIILGPLVALTLGESLTFALKQRKMLARGLLLCLIIAILMKTGFDSCKLAVTRSGYTALKPNLKQAIAMINKLTPKNAVILCDWPDGYPIQTYCRRPTNTDGMLENPEIIKRIVEIAKIYYSSNEDDLTAFCNKYKITHILISNYKTQVYAVYAGRDYPKFNNPLYAYLLPKPLLLYKFICEPKKLEKFRLLYRNEEFLIYEVDTL
ncbi:MAG: STT3 domain-containing protein, partial [Candidatus Omnitrophica bacterium]|nr:STT3 domain-containing protein [Candidatus Omnitrophota bacterium]